MNIGIESLRKILMLVKEQSRRGNAFVNGIIFYIINDRMPSEDEYLEINFLYGAQMASQIIMDEQEDDLDIVEPFELMPMEYIQELNQPTIDAIVSKIVSGYKIRTILKELKIAVRTFYWWIERGREQGSQGTIYRQLYKAIEKAKQSKVCKKQIDSILQDKMF